MKDLVSISDEVTGRMVQLSSTGRFSMSTVSTYIITPFTNTSNSSIVSNSSIGLNQGVNHNSIIKSNGPAYNSQASRGYPLK